MASIQRFRPVHIKFAPLLFLAFRSLSLSLTFTLSRQNKIDSKETSAFTQVLFFAQENAQRNYNWL